MSWPMTSMKGGFNDPPNPPDAARRPRRRRTSMKGGFNDPPNGDVCVPQPVHPRTSMKGGFNDPPNLDERVIWTPGPVTLQ